MIIIYSEHMPAANSLHCRGVGYIILPCGVGTLEAQPDRGRKKPIHPIRLSMNPMAPPRLYERLTIYVTLLRNMRVRVEDDLGIDRTQKRG